MFNSTSNIRTEEIPLYRSTTTGSLYDLRNVLDFRPVKLNLASDATIPSSATENPGISIYALTYPWTPTAPFKFTVEGIKLPKPSSQITFDAQHYLGRIDVVTIDKNRSVSVIYGNPSLNPITPRSDPDKLSLSVLTIAPYPSLSPAYGNKIGRPDLACLTKSVVINRFTMRDIGVLQNRIENLEYYTTLNSLEKSASSMTIRDEMGQDRFKNGIFVDSLKDATLSSNAGKKHGAVRAHRVPGNRSRHGKPHSELS